MKRVICVNSKNYNLTNGREYTTRQSNDDAEVYEVVNDRGLVRNYSADLFTDVIQTTTRVLSNQEQINSITVYVEGDIIRLEFIVSVTSTVRGQVEENQENTIEIHWSPSYNSTTISCGIRELYDLDDLITQIKSLTVDEEVQKELFKAVIELAIDTEENPDDNCALYILSTTVSSVGHLRDVLDDLSCNFVEVSNPNSGNDIIMWTIKV